MRRVVFYALFLPVMALGIDKEGSWGGGGGPIFLWVKPNLDEINSEIKGVIDKEFDKDMWLKGGGGCFSIWKNLRIGGVGGGGNQVKSGNKRKTELSLGYGGFLTEYVIPLGKLQFFLGGIIGGGGIELKILRSTQTSWQDIWDNFKSEDDIPAGDYEAYLNCSFFHYQPYIGAQYPLTPWAYLNLKGGYFGTLLGEWKEMGSPITGAPEMDISNYCISVGIIFGYFTK